MMTIQLTPAIRATLPIPQESGQRVLILNTRTGRIFREFANLRAAEDCLESLDYEMPKLARFLDIRTYAI